MGTDIHGVYQTRYSPDQAWRTEGKIEDSRNYRLFAVLSDVHNGYGFAGVQTHNPVEPIQKGRGLPEDFAVEDETHQWGWSVAPKTEWMGDHGHGWVLLSEVLDWPHWDRKLREFGVVSRQEYEKMQEGSMPESWSGGICGHDVVMYREGVENWTHRAVEWEVRTMRDCCALFLKWCDYLDCKYGRDNVRLVFGFDS